MATTGSLVQEAWMSVFSVIPPRFGYFLVGLERPLIRSQSQGKQRPLTSLSQMRLGTGILMTSSAHTAHGW